jgi:hypothetical protein
MSAKPRTPEQKERHREYQREYMRARRKKAKRAAAIRAWKMQNRDHILAYARQYQQAHREEYAEALRRHRKTDKYRPNTNADKKRRAFARIMGATSEHE